MSKERADEEKIAANGEKMRKVEGANCQILEERMKYERKYKNEKGIERRVEWRKEERSIKDRNRQGYRAC